MKDGPSTVVKGAQGEARAASFLESRGWSVLARNFRCRAGEIDLIARRKDVLAFFEVKAWRSVPAEDLARAVGHRKQRRIAHAARLFLSRHPELAAAHQRFDVVFLGGEGGIRHIPGAFSEEGID
jgi:putative endonuclease